MGFDQSVGSSYDMQVFLTPLGVDKFLNRGLLADTKYFSIGDAEVNYLTYDGLEYTYDMISGGTYSPTQPTVGYILNLRGTVDRNVVIDQKALPTNRKSVRSAVWRYPTITPVEQVLTAFKLSDTHKVFDKPIVLGSRNMWHTGRTTAVNQAEGFLYYYPPAQETDDYIRTTEPTIGTVTTGATDHVPFPGISVNDGRRSYTEIQYWYFLNKTNAPMILGDFSLSNITPVSHTLHSTTVDEDYSSEFVKITYYLKWDSVKDGKTYIDTALNVFVPQFVYKKTRTVLFPFEVLRFGVSFEVVQVGSVITHWRGQNYSDQLAREGQYRFTLTLTATPSANSTNTVAKASGFSANMDVVIKVKDSAYNASTYITPTPIGWSSTGFEKQQNNAA